MAPHSAERRNELRVQASGTVQVVFADPDITVVAAELVERSSSGVRIAHESAALSAGLEIKIRDRELVVRARVIWTHLQEGRRVSGCALL